MAALHWIGKEKVVNHHQQVPYKVLEHQYGFTATDGLQKGKETGAVRVLSCEWCKIVHLRRWAMPTAMGFCPFRAVLKCTKLSRLYYNFLLDMAGEMLFNKCTTRE